MSKININTHHAYLNTDIVISSDLTDVVLKDELTGTTYHLEGSPISVNLCAGKHKLYNESLKEEIYVEIEDAIKLGGSTIKSAFVFDNNPWVFVTTKDRLYASNKETAEERVEYNLSPDDIVSLGSYYGKPCSYFLLKTKCDYSIFDVNTGNSVISFSDHIYSNSHLVIFKKDDKIVVYDYRSSKVVVEFSGQYSFGSKLYFVKEKVLHGLNLSSNYINKIPSVGDLESNYLLVKNHLLKLISNGVCRKKYSLFFLGNGETNISNIEIVVPYYIESFLDEKTSKFKELINKYKSFSEEQKLLINRNRELLISCRGIKIEKILSDWKEKKLTHIVSGHIVTYPQEPYIVPFIIKEENEGLLDFNNIKIVEEKPLPRASVEEKQKESDFNHSDFLGSSESNNLYITLSEGKIWFHNKQTNEEISLFDDIFDTSSYNSAYFTSDGKNVVFVGKDKSMGFIGFEEMIKKPFEVEGSTIARYAGYNGYKPEILFDESNGRKPVWRDPITLKKISEAEMSNHAFLSPDGKYVAEMQKKTVYFNRITKEELSAEEYLNLRKKYEWTSNSTEEEKKKKAELRKLLLDNCGKEELFHYVIEHNEKLIHSAQDGKMSEKQIAHRIDELNKRDEEEYLNSKSEFVHLFIDILGYVCYKEVGSDVQNRILIGRSVWFLNYVSFSYDSRYLAFGAKMKEDTWRFSEEGVFEIYDLKEKKIVDRKDKESDLHAVWMTMFSQNGDVAYYDSHANAMVAYSESDYRYTNIAKGKSLLCFSPSGRYIALSDQNYISYLHHSNENWGHQPSGNIYIHETVDLENCLEQYNDFGDGIDGTTRTTRRAGNVASAAFSSDEKRLLAVGEDGVIVIRNLALSYWEDIIDDYVISGGNDEKQYYRKRERNGIVTISCNTPDGLENKVVDFWAETDETLDSEQGLIYSEDYSELKKSLNIYNKEYKLPDGVKTIKQKAFSGRWGYEGDYNSLETLYLPDSIETIEETFEECPSLKYIYVSKNSEEKIKNLLPHLIDVIIPL